jgi:hypothetical protein
MSINTHKTTWHVNPINIFNAAKASNLRDMSVSTVTVYSLDNLSFTLPETGNFIFNITNRTIQGPSNACQECFPEDKQGRVQN